MKDNIFIQLIKKLLRKLLLSWSPSYDWRVVIVLSGLMLYVGAIFYQTRQTVVVHHDDYQKRINGLRRDSVPITQLRGMIYSEIGEMIAASLPEYDVFIDFRNKNDVYYKEVYDSIENKKKNIQVKLIPQDTIDYYFSDNGPGARYLHQLAPDIPTAKHARNFREAYKAGTGRYRVLKTVSYLDYKKMRESAPYFSKKKGHIGIFTEDRPHRQRPYGERRMAAATIGGVFSTDTFRIIDGVKVNYKGHGRNGLEATFDSLLAGEPGIGFTQRVRNRRTTIVERDPVDGADVYTTLDMDMQTILDYELSKRILELQAHGGWAAVMEVKTGKIKAISNLERRGDQCVEDYNHFVMDLTDPGSTFKTVSYMVMLDDGKVTPDTWVDTGNTKEHPSDWVYYEKTIRDDHPVGAVTADEALVQSSNISFAKLTTQAYGSNPQQYLDLIDKTRIFEDMKLNVEFHQANYPRNRKKDDQNWSKASLAQISYGYETRIPGMYILNFYNAIANDGKLMRPYIVNRVVKDGVNVYEHEPEVINSHMCKESTIKAIRHALEGVVERGTAATQWNSRGVIIREGAKSKKVKIAGKTGTAQRFENGGYKGTGHYVSFAGYFPADDPQYTCLVVIDARPGGNFGRPGGGYMAGPVFRNFAEQVYARSCYRSIDEVSADSAGLVRGGMYPKAKRGPLEMTQNLIKRLKLTDHYNFLDVKDVDTSKPAGGQVPDASGMGANDAVFLFEHAGLRVNVSGHGKVVSQTIPAGSAYTRGQTIGITLK